MMLNKFIGYYLLFIIDLKTIWIKLDINFKPETQFIFQKIFFSIISLISNFTPSWCRWCRGIRLNSKATHVIFNSFCIPYFVSVRKPLWVFRVELICGFNCGYMVKNASFCSFLIYWCKVPRGTKGKNTFVFSLLVYEKKFIVQRSLKLFSSKDKRQSCSQSFRLSHRRSLSVFLCWK